MSSERGGSGLRRELGTVTTTLFTAAMIVGTGIFAAFGAATAAAGTGILIAVVIGGSVALATGISAAQLGVNFPEEGGAFTWARAFGHNTIGFIAGCGYLGKVLVSMSVIALALGTYLGQAIPSLPTHLVAALTVLAITGLNIFGIELTSKMLIAMLAVLVGLLVLYGAAAVRVADPANLGPILGTQGPLALFAGAAIFFWSWDGFMRAAIMTSEVKDPRRAIPIGIVGGVASAYMLVWYLVTHYAALQLHKSKRIASPVFSWFGIAGCVSLLVALSVPALIAAASTFVVLLGARWLIRRDALRTNPT